MRTAAKHGPIRLRVQRRQPDIGEQPAAFDQMRDAALVAKRLSRDGGVIDKLFFHHIAEILVAGQFGLYEIGIGQFVGVAPPVYKDDFLETIVDVRILDDATERSKAGSVGEK